MASRRSRIKGLANIPQRRKNNNEVDIKLEPLENNIQEDATNVSDIVGDTFTNSHKPNESLNHYEEILEKNDKALIHQKEEIGSTKTLENVLGSEKISRNQLPSKEVINDGNISKASIQEHTNNEIKPIRRKFIKPAVNLISKKSKISSEAAQEAIQSGLTSEVQKVNNSNSLKCENENKTINIELKKEVTRTNENSETEITLNEINFVALPHSVNNETNVCLADSSVKTPNLKNAKNAELEYPPPPPSPSITNRVRIKAIPKLRYRKNSFSASESEDEMRKTNRIRNDSVCSSTSVSTEIPMDGSNLQKPKEINTIIQKKCNRTEQTRKLAEARREFQRRFASNVDRQKLTMMDLIFYNPDTNPMQKNEPKTKAENAVGDNSKNTSVDDPPAKESTDNDKSDEENDVPVPQIKIGPTGEIILDEKSLVIERKDIKKQREEIANSQVVNGDFDVGYGIYKRQKRSKFWTTDETLRFYKALNTLGTDFTLMCELFPERTRRELKMKFNKEEKINRSLIDKALMQPCGFDFYVLKQEVELEKREKAELEKLKLEETKKKEERKEKEVQRKRKKIEEIAQSTEATRTSEVASTAEATKTEPIKSSETTRTTENRIIEKKKPRKMKRKRLDINSILEDTDDADESDLDTNSEDEVISKHKPTRSGRMPKVPRKFDVSDEMVVEKIVKKSKDEIEPGSIMIITENGPTGEPIYKIFMITEDNEKIALPNSEEETKAIQLKKGITAKNILTISATHTDDEEIEEPFELPEENNVTIPADETVTTLKSSHYSVSTEAISESVQSCSELAQDSRHDKTYQASVKLLEDDKNSPMQVEEIITNLEKENISTQANPPKTAPDEINHTVTEDENVTTMMLTDPADVSNPENVDREEKKTIEISQYVIFNQLSTDTEEIDID